MAKASVPCPFCSSYDVDLIRRRLFRYNSVCERCGSYSPTSKTILGSAIKWHRRFPRNMAGTLKTCPYCGSDYLSRVIASISVGKNTCFVACNSCGAATAECNTLEDAVALWNNELFVERSINFDQKEKTENN